MITEQELRAKLRKISALFEGATTTGEREAAAAAIDRVRKALVAAEPVEPPPKCSSQILIVGTASCSCLCVAATVSSHTATRASAILRSTLRAPKSFLNTTLWREFLEIKSALDEYLNEATERIIKEEVFGEDQEAEEIIGSLGAGS